MSSAQTERATSTPQVASGAKSLERGGKPRTYLGMAWRQFRRNKLAMVGLGIVIVIVLLALGAGLITEHITGRGPNEQMLINNFKGIGEDGYWLGSDELGRDVFARLLFGARISLGVAGLSILAALAIGVIYGIVSGYYGGWVDSVLMRFVDMVLAIPAIFLLLLIVTLWRVGPWTLALVIATVSWVTLARLVRGEVMAVRSRDYIDAARVVGATDRRLMFRHILPNVAPVIIVWASLTVPALILVEAALSFLGLGVQAPTPSWGNMLTNAQRVWAHSWTLVFLPGFAIYITVFAINLMGNGLRDALDPRLTE